MFKQTGLILVTCALTGCAGVQTIAQGTHDFLAQAQVPGTHPKPSDYFCGNQVKPNGPQGVDQCLGKATDRGGFGRTTSEGVPATEHTEFWGKLYEVPHDSGDAAEISFAAELDHGWTQYSDPSVVHALNTPSSIVNALTPHDLIGFTRDASGAPLDQLQPDSGGIHAYVGAPAIHVEANGYRAADITTGGGGQAMTQNPAPDQGWTVTRDGGASLWPFDPVSPPTLAATPGGTPAIQDYVRVVGTLWEDEPHTLSPSCNNGQCEGGRTEDQAQHARDAKDCWHAGSLNQGHWGRGYSEIHPVDVLQRINDMRPGYRKDVLRLVALCGGGEVTFEIHAGTPRAGESVHFERIDNLTFTVRPSDVVARDETIIADGLRVHIKLDRPGWGSGDPKYFGGYHVWVASP